jgi:hypothetical protein
MGMEKHQNHNQTLRATFVKDKHGVNQSHLHGLPATPHVGVAVTEIK